MVMVMMVVAVLFPILYPRKQGEAKTGVAVNFHYHTAVVT